MVDEDEYEIDGKTIHGCPARRVTARSMTMIAAYGHYKENILPVSGGWLDQSAAFVQAVGVIRNAVAEYEEKQRLAQPGGGHG